MPKANYDFGGYATKNNLKCTDGRIILPDAFKGDHEKTVPLVWQHLHDAPGNVLGHAVLENREDGVYAYGYFNDSEDAQRAKILVKHGDIKALSIYANSLIEKAKNVAHGVIREVSLVLSGSNPGAVIDNVSISHGDGTTIDLDDEAIIYPDLGIDLPEEEDKKQAKKKLSHAEDSDDEPDEDEEDEEETVGDVFKTLNDKQKAAVYAIVGDLLEGGEMEQSADSKSNDDEGDSQNIMKKNVFDGSAINVVSRPKLQHSDFMAIVERAKVIGSLKDAFRESEVGTEFLQHSITDIDYLFPDARAVTREPVWVSRQMGWVPKVFNGTHHVPFSRIKSWYADLTVETARAKGYITGNQKVEEVFAVLRRTTTPHTVYKLQKLDRDDIVDITDFDVVAWLKREMRWMLDEELARAILVGDGRDPVAQVNDHIPTTNIRPIWGDDAVYTYYKQVALARTTDEMIDDLISARTEYRGSGSPSLYVGPTFLTAMLLLRDLDGRRLYRTETELASELRVKEIVEVPIMDGLSRGTTPVYNLRAIVANLQDYTVGADKGGEVNFFDDFDLNYNKYEYLIETRLSGALVVPKSAIVLEQSAT